MQAQVQERHEARRVPVGVREQRVGAQGLVEGRVPLVQAQEREGREAKRVPVEVREQRVGAQGMEEGRVQLVQAQVRRGEAPSERTSSRD